VETLDRDLSERVDELIQAHKAQQLLSTTGTQAAIGELAARTAGLERAIREIALEVERLTASE
jgi:predicted sugar kinase